MQRLAPLLALGFLGATLPDGAVILPASEPIQLCSRPQPVGVTGRRDASEAEVLAAERELPAYMARLGGEIEKNASRYWRQYLGVLQGERPALYINLVLPIEVPADAPP